MQTQTIDLFRLGWQHLRHNLRETLYLKTGLDVTKPRSIKANINERCNYKCLYCDFWRLPHYQNELSIEQWQAALLSLKDFLGWYNVEFVGGEPFIKKGFLDLLEFCHEQGISWGVITNGSVFSNPHFVQRVVAACPTKLDISVDSAQASIHDTVRGIEHSLEKITHGIQLLREACAQQNQHFPIRIKPTVHRLNFRYLPELVEWVQTVGASTIDFNVVKPWTAEVKSQLWIRDPVEQRELQTVVERLITLKQQGAPIETSPLKLRSFVDHFQEKTVNHGVLPCRIGLRDYHIQANGNVQTCGLYPTLGNVKQHSAQEIWQRAQSVRAQMVQCSQLGKAGCANFCLSSQTPFTHQVGRGLVMLKQLKHS